VIAELDRDMLAAPPPQARPRVTLVHIRHGETDWNAEGRLQGQRDVPLNPVGRGQAARNGRALAAHLAERGIDPDDLDWVASPLGRARETMAIVRDTAGLDPSDYRLDDSLKEVTFGLWEGFTIAELKVRDPAGIAARKADKWSFVPPGGESYAMLSARIAGFLDHLERDTVVVSHGGVMRVLQGLLLRVPEREVPLLDVPQGEFFVFAPDGGGAWV
jgi:broad specificity phosphatase PhoE